ncbi:hypothetical protein TNCV_2108501 [Trichonephila clavipes]|nr:hypothetical protein TNCV_2108501 [Trichonephila clavipes]
MQWMVGGTQINLQTEKNWLVTKPIFDEPSALKEKRKTNPTSKNLPVVCSLNQCENSGKNNNEIQVGTTTIFQAMVDCFEWWLG